MNLETATAALTQSNEALTAWLAEMEPKQHNPLDVDAAVQPADVYSKQMIELQAEDRAIDDTIAVLEEALHESKITLTQYLKHVRSLGDKQFKARALANKVLAAQRQLSGLGRP
jgi:ESCRT-I complex subunit TSG101